MTNLEYIDEDRYVVESNLPNRLTAIKGLLESAEITGKRILEVGCWTGIIGGSFLKDRCVVHGLDIDEGALVLAEKKGLKARKLDIEKEDFPYVSDFFDFVIFSEVIEHVVDYNHVLDEIHRVLRKNGIMVLSTPNLNSGQNMLRIIRGEDIISPYNKVSKDNHIRLFSFKSIQTLLINHGFRVDAVKYVSYPPGSFLGLLRQLLSFIFPRIGDIVLVKAIKN
jgi:2-polyprenyl-3-methyl-5-hydroxy-6-metoxy-1,4-benzoquinol methylase